ncbi:MAG: glycosyltransferase, partial [Ignavibacteriae bacterium]|nr:glycosyltransferase [Ignavibacteriota bacterium]
MSKNVLHFVRKSTQLKATFINDQISNHLNYTPYIVIKEKVNKKYDGGFAEFDFAKYKIIYLEIKKNITYKYLRKISKTEVQKILNFVKDNNIDILHFHYGTDAGIYYEIIKKSDIPTVVSFYGYESSSFPKLYFGLGKKYLQNRVFRYADKLLVMSDDMKNDLLKLGCNENKIIVHYFGVKGKIFNCTDRKYIEKDKYTLLNVSSLVAQKGHLFLLQGITELIKKGIKNFKLRIIGTGELENELKSYIKKNKLGEYVKILKPMLAQSDEILSEYRNSDIFIHPSVIPKNGDKEGIPGAIVEAMFFGLPVVSTYHAGIPYIIKDGYTGLLVKEWNVEKLSDNIANLINNTG